MFITLGKIIIRISNTKEKTTLFKFQLLFLSIKDIENEYYAL
jgi:hypothetical protein